MLLRCVVLREGIAKGDAAVPTAVVMLSNNGYYNTFMLLDPSCNHFCFTINDHQQVDDHPRYWDFDFCVPPF